MKSEPSNKSRRHLANRRVLIFSGLLFGLFLLELASLNLLVPFDLRIHTWIQEHRACGLDKAATILKDWTTAPFATVLVIVTVAGLLAYRRRWQDLVSFIVIVAGAALLGEWVKALVSRARPSALSFVDYGNSFPSGHATSAATIFGAIYYLICPNILTCRWKKIIGIATVTVLVAIIAYQRVYFTHHWFSDVIGGLLLGTSWLLFVIAMMHGLIDKKILIGLGGAFGAASLALWLFPEYRVNVPTPLAFRSVPASQIDLTGYAPDSIQPRVRNLGVGRPPQTIWRFLKAKTAIDLTLAQGQDYLLIFAARPRNPSGRQTCRTMELSLNGRSLKTLMLLDGWRDYQIPIDAQAISAGKNQLVINFDNYRTDSLFVTDLEIHLRARDG